MRLLVPLAAAVICFSNLAALGLAAINRGATEAEVTLTERELELVDTGPESTATQLSLIWTGSSEASWRHLTPPQLTSVGFDCTMDPNAPESAWWYRRQPPRRGYVVLELDDHPVVPPGLDGRPAATGQPSVGSWIETRAARSGTRLRVVDVGRDASALRANYSDRQRFIITEAQIRVGRVLLTGTQYVVYGTVSRVLPGVLNVPRRIAAELRAIIRDKPARAGVPRYAVTLRYGRFHEPWVTGVRPM